MNDDLSGILVVSVEQAVAAPYASCRLADAGARVIKIERPEGDFARDYDSLVHGESAYFVWLNRGKESVRLDLKLEADRAVLSRLVGEADVFIQNLAPGVIERLGFGIEKLREAHPRLITCSISGYGDNGPLAHLKAYDLLVQAESGLSLITGNEHGPARVGVSVCDIAAGMTALSSIMQALYARERTGRGRHISLSLYHAMSDWMNVPYLQFVYGGKPPARSGLNHPTLSPYGVYQCADGKAILISIQNEREWVSLCEKVLGLPELASDARFAANERRVSNRPALDAVLSEAFGEHDREEMGRRLEAGRIAYGRLSTMEDVAAHPQNRYVEVDTPTGPVRMLAPGATIDGRPAEFAAVPRLGEHTERVLAEFSASGRQGERASGLAEADGTGE